MKLSLVQNKKKVKNGRTGCKRRSERVGKLLAKLFHKYEQTSMEEMQQQNQDKTPQP